ncbi:hypothetical protein EDF56_103239 [Novosphingobium sp. PhB165]|uniref:hypothetical protein n=1 Tax=Novosphingobium sp. PhB165 TaxID=2485105 RepID=UPI00104364B1|nr:hypothetical protein [Novosphingobium sp. PhB165]TCM19596.1 hypothetical protein EDF56_103239 [Novosphingobium sp. PhB165]
MSDLQAVDITVVERGVPKQGTHGKSPERAHQDWTIKGLPTEAVSVAREAAKASGMKINAWVSHALTEAAQDIGKKCHEGLAESSENEFANIEIKKLRERNEELIQTVNTLTALLAKSALNK